jgi:cation/acetate symporter
VIPLVAIVGVVVATLLVGSRGWRGPKSTSDFLVASRAVRPGLNASAISGEYLSAASFLGVAGLVMRYGFDMAWYPVGYTAGYLLLLLLVAAPLRRSGAYTIPDFAEARLVSPKLRKVAAGFVILIGVFYLLPQLKPASRCRRLSGCPTGWASSWSAPSLWPTSQCGACGRSRSHRRSCTG